MGAFRDRQFLYRFVTMYLGTFGGIFAFIKFIFMNLSLLMPIIGLFGYVISPIDLIPECIFGIFGMIDDLFAVGMIVLVVFQGMREFLQRGVVRD